MKKFTLIALLGIGLFSSFTVWAGDESEVQPVKFQKINLSVDFEGEHFENLIYVTKLDPLDDHKIQCLVIIPKQPDIIDTVAGFGAFSDVGTLEFTLDNPKDKVKVQIKIDWKDNQNIKTGYVAEMSGSYTDEKNTFPITGTAVLQEGSIELK